MSAPTISELAHNRWHEAVEAEGITIEYVHPPIPLRHMDYVAYRDPEELCGYGATAEEARLHLLELEQQ